MAIAENVQSKKRVYAHNQVSYKPEREIDCSTMPRVLKGCENMVDIVHYRLVGAKELLAFFGVKKVQEPRILWKHVEFEKGKDNYMQKISVTISDNDDKIEVYLTHKEMRQFMEVEELDSIDEDYISDDYLRFVVKQ